MHAANSMPEARCWTHVVVGVLSGLILYAGCYGPWHYARSYFGVCSPVTRLAHVPFAPLASAIEHLPPSFGDSYREYCLWWVRKGIDQWGDDLDRY